MLIVGVNGVGKTTSIAKLAKLWKDKRHGVVLAAGSGTRLRPLTNLKPKALCPVGDVPLVDLAFDAVQHVTDGVAINASDY